MRSSSGGGRAIRPSTTMLYLLDANVLIRAKNQYYEFGRVDQYWRWLVSQAERGAAKIPVEIYGEITVGNDELAAWAKQNKAALVLDEEVNVDLLQRVITKGYAPDLSDSEIGEMGRDPFLIAYALADAGNRTVVTGEPRSKKIRQNRPIPSICDDLGIKSCDPWQFARALDFRAS